jgi:hypothetical protein
MTDRCLLSVFAIGIALAATGCDSTRSQVPTAAHDGHMDASPDAGPADASRCVVGQSAVGDCTL